MVQGQAQVVPALREIRPQRDCPLMAGNGLREPALHLQDETEMVPGLRQIGLPAQRLSF